MSHDHEHVHGHDHDHDHGHEHQATIFETAWGVAQLEAHTHEQAATVSITVHTNAGDTLAFSDIVSLMQQLAEKAEAEGGIIGHIKAFARQGDSFVHASVTAADIAPALEGDTVQCFGEDADIQIVAIVLLVDQDLLVRICEELLGGLDSR